MDGDDPAAARAVSTVRAVDAIDSELTATIRRIFLTPASSARSVLFCTTPDDQTSDVAWQAAQLLAAQSGQRVAFVEYSANAPAPTDSTHALVTRVTWRPNDATLPTPDSGLPSRVVGDRVPDLYAAFSFVIVDATGPVAEDLVSLARDVDGVIVVITKQETRVDAADVLVTALRRGHANLLGAILTAD